MSDEHGLSLDGEVRTASLSLDEALHPNRNAALLAELFNVHHRRLVGFLARKLGGDRAQAGDLAQDTYARIAAYKGSLNRENSRGFLYQVARNLLVDHYRARHVTPVGDAGSLDSVPAPLGDPEELALAEAGLQQLKAAILDLPPRCRQVFVLHRFEDYSYVQIASHCGISVSMVEKQMTKALRRIAAAMRT